MTPIMVGEDKMVMDGSKKAIKEIEDRRDAFECPFKVRIELKFCTKCGFSDHSLEDFPIMLEKIMNKRNVDHLSRVHKKYVLYTKNLHIITRQGTRVGEEKEKNTSTILQNHEYPNHIMQQETFKNLTQVFKELATQKYKLDHENIKVNELLQLLLKEDAVCRLVNLLSMLKINHKSTKESIMF